MQIVLDYVKKCHEECLAQEQVRSHTALQADVPLHCTGPVTSWCVFHTLQSMPSTVCKRTGDKYVLPRLQLMKRLCVHPSQLRNAFDDCHVLLSQDARRAGPMHKFDDPRVDVAVYFIAPHRLKQMDCQFMTELAKAVPVLPVLAKACPHCRRL